MPNASKSVRRYLQLLLRRMIYHAVLMIPLQPAAPLSVNDALCSPTLLAYFIPAWQYATKEREGRQTLTSFN